VLAFFASDGRLFFVIPMGNRTCVGTTDTRVSEPETSVSEEDRDFILDNVNRYLRLKKPLSREDIIAERCGVRPLVVRGSGASDETDWLQLSRKHEIEADRERRHISIFGGKLTDCINVGNEVAQLVAQMGIPVPYPRYRWYGEPPRQTREEFFHQARLMNLDGYTDPESTEPLSQRLWRRYGLRALELLEAIREDPEDARILIRGTEYIRAEVRLTAHREMVTKLDDFLRRRSKIAQVLSEEEIRHAPGLREACDWFFGDQAEEKLQEYFGESEAARRSVA
jgi:glycerol-3-phosphate dehydrogenase